MHDTTGEIYFDKLLEQLLLNTRFKLKKIIMLWKGFKLIMPKTVSIKINWKCKLRTLKNLLTQANY